MAAVLCVVHAALVSFFFQKIVERPSYPTESHAADHAWLVLALVWPLWAGCLWYYGRSLGRLLVPLFFGLVALIPLLYYLVIGYLISRYGFG